MRSVAGLLVVSLTACSFALSGPHEPVTPSETCETDSAAPVVDTIAGLALVGFAGFVFYKDYSLGESAELRGASSAIIGLPSLLIGATYLIAAHGGFAKEHRCETALKRAAELRDANPPRSPPASGSGSDDWGRRLDE